jgi:hypothetical protein
MAKRLRDGESLFTAQEWKERIPALFNTSKGDVFVLGSTYDNWIQRNNLIPGTNTTLREYLKKAREDGWMIKHKKQQDQMIREAQAAVKILQNLPLGSNTKMKRRSWRWQMQHDEKGKAIRGTEERVKSSESTEVISTDIDPRMVSEKRRGAEFILSRLDPAYAEKAENKNLNIMVSLKDLRQAAEKKSAPEYNE